MSHSILLIFYKDLFIVNPMNRVPSELFHFLINTFISHFRTDLHEILINHFLHLFSIFCLQVLLILLLTHLFTASSLALLFWEFQYVILNHLLLSQFHQHSILPLLKRLFSLSRHFKVLLFINLFHLFLTQSL